MSYVDALYDRKEDLVRVAERVDGKRILVDHRPEYNFYVKDPRGNIFSTYGDRVSEVKCKNYPEFQKNVKLNAHNQMFESDIKPLHKTLEKHYTGQDGPVLQTAFFDIEVNFDPERGYSSPEDAFMDINAIGVYLQWCDVMVCLTVPPPTLNWDQASIIAAKFPEVILCHDEKEMLEQFLTIIDDADVLSGWNSEGYDIPYTVNRIIKVLGKSESRRMCLWDQFPKRRDYESYGKDAMTYDLIGRVHLDYLQLYRKYNYEERHSYTLDFIGEMEVGEKKVAYEGSLDQLYKQDYEKFIEYNIQDTLLLDKLDKKLGFIDLANQIAHDNTVLIPTVMGTVAAVEQAVINEAHRRGMVVPDRVPGEKDSRAAGAYVAKPKKGYHEWIGSSDLNSLYPSIIRALNMAPETIVGQLRLEYTDREIAQKQEDVWLNGKKRKGGSFADAWNNKFATTEYDYVRERDTHHKMWLDMEDGTSVEVTGADVYNLIFNGGQPWNISANGTIFKTDTQGVIPGLLERWYAERKQLQKKKKEAEKAGNKEQTAFWDKRQLVKKILLNSAYGALLNSGCRFFDKRIGQSTTLTGRCIVKHMSAKTNEMLTGEYDHVGKCIIYGDTDSVYFSAVPALPEGAELDLDSATALYDHISDEVSATFPGMLKADFNVPLDMGQVMAAGREVVGRAGLFITKKRYAINVLDMEGYRPEGGKMKVMGMDIKRSDTPQFIQDFLGGILKDALSGIPENDVIEQIKEFKKGFKNLNPWEKGMPKRVNNLTPYTAKYERIKGINNSKSRSTLGIQPNKKDENNMIPGHVSASIHWNYLLEMNSDKYSMRITDGMKVIVCRLKNNPMGYTNVAYPVDEKHLPDWFKELPFDEDGMEQAVLNKKIENVLGAMDWDLTRIYENEAFSEFFEF